MKGRQGKSSLLPKEQYEALHQSLPGQGYVLGWGVGNNGAILEQAASNTRWYCRALVNLQNNYAILIATNIAGQNAEAAVAELTDQLVIYQQSRNAAP